MDVKQKTAITPKELNFKKRKPVFLVIRKIEKGSYVAACYLVSSQMPGRTAWAKVNSMKFKSEQRIFTNLPGNTTSNSVKSGSISYPVNSWQFSFINSI